MNDDRRQTRRHEAIRDVQVLVISELRPRFTPLFMNHGAAIIASYLRQ